MRYVHQYNMQAIAPPLDPAEMPEISITLESEDHTIPTVSSVII